MARALTVTVRHMEESEIGGYVAGLRRRKDYFLGASCNFWVFADPGAPGAFTEFTEARDRETLAAAHRGAGPELEGMPILTEVELI